jgi:hypothetical protein
VLRLCGAQDYGRMTRFLERMNTLLINAEVPGLFEGNEHASLMIQCREGVPRAIAFYFSFSTFLHARVHFAHDICFEIM